MKRDENGIAVPHEADPLPWGGKISPGDRWYINSRGILLGYSSDTFDYQIHAANYHARLADIVRRIVSQCEKWKNAPASELTGFIEEDTAIQTDASALWDEMKGGGDAG
jgi:hypothetical protein